MKELTCGTCSHFARIESSEADNMIRGECRGAPPEIIPLYQLNPVGIVEVEAGPSMNGSHVILGSKGKATVYQTQLAGMETRYRIVANAMPACAFHAPREEWMESLSGN